MQELLARVMPHRRLLSIILSVSVALVVAVVAYGVLGSPAPRALARPSEPAAMLAASRTTPASTDGAPPTVTTDGAPASAPTAAPAPAEPAPAKAEEPAWPERVTGRVVDAQKQ